MNLKHSLIFFAYTFVVVGSKNTTDEVQGVAVIAAESKVKPNEINQLGDQVNKSKIHEALPIEPSVSLVNASSSTPRTPTEATMDHVVAKNLTKPIITEKSTKTTTAFPKIPIINTTTTTSTTTTTEKTSTKTIANTTTTITTKAPTTKEPPTTSKPKPTKPLVTKDIEDDPEALAKLHEKQVSEEIEPPPVPQTQLLRDRTGQRNTDMFVPLITIMFTIPLAAGVFITSYRRLRDCWSTRHYRRMDFLVDGMYND